MQPDSKHGNASKNVDADHAEFFRALHAGDAAFLGIFLCQHPDAAHWNTPDGTPPLVLAAGSSDRDAWESDSRSYGHQEVMELLISYGADVNAKDAQGRSVLLEECYNDQREEVIEMLLKNGADPNVADTLKTTPLHVIATRDYGEDLITVLVKGGAKTDAQDWQGNTPLHIAAGESPLEFTTGHQDAVRKLLSHGASPDIKNNHLRTPLDSANMNGDFQEDGKRPTAEIIEAVVTSKTKPRGPKTPTKPEKTDGTGSKVPDPRLPPPPRGKFKLPPSP